MLNLTAVNLKRASRLPLIAAFAAGLFVAALLVSAAVTRQVGSRLSPSAPLAPASDVRPGGVSTTDRQISTLQDRLRQNPTDQKSATQLGLAYLQRARE